MAKIMVVDDHADARYLLAAAFTSRGHEVIEADSGREGIRLAHEHQPAAIVSDVLMPVMDGFELCRHLRTSCAVGEVPFVFYSATYTQADEREFALSIGADRYFEKPMDPLRLIAAVEELIDADRPQTEAAAVPTREFWQQHGSLVLRKLEQKVDELQRANANLRAGEDRLRQTMMATVRTIDRIVEYRDPYTAGHQHRVGELSAAIGRDLGLDEHRVEGLLLGGYLHDVGKICTPAEILTRPGALSDLEMAMVRAHSRMGFDILRDMDFPWPVAQMALQHHERLDGSGYPDGLVGERILHEARVLAVADVVEAMATHRPYRPALGIEAALAEIESGSGRIYDADVVAACLRLFRERGYRLAA